MITGLSPDGRHNCQVESGHPLDKAENAIILSRLRLNKAVERSCDGRLNAGYHNIHRAYKTHNFLKTFFPCKGRHGRP